MRKKKSTLKKALLLPIISIILMIILTFSVLWQFDYSWLSNEHSQKVLNALNENIQIKLDSYLNEPLRINQMLADIIAYQSLYRSTDSSEIESILLNISKDYYTDLPQISVIGYGGENQNFVGIRLNDDGSQSLMLKDSRTDGLLNIYEGNTVNSSIIASYEAYDPRTRPWYAPIYDNPTIQWSEMYVNQDEKREITISSIAPILNTNRQVAGVATLDIKLSRISDFLKLDQTKGTGVIYIIDDQWHVIAHSTDASNFSENTTADSSVSLVLANAMNQDVISKSAKLLMDLSRPTDSIHHMSISGKKYYLSMSSITQPANLNWHIVSVIPEKDLMGAVVTRQLIIILLTLIASLSFTFLVYRLLNRVMKPILTLAEVTKSFDVDQLNLSTLSEIDSIVEETDLFIHSFNLMAQRLNDSFKQISISEGKYRSLVENSDEMIVTISKDATLKSVNSKFEENVGKSRDVLIGTHITELLTTSSEKKQWLEWLDHAVQSKEKSENTFTITSTQGHTIYFIVTMILLPNSDETVLCTFSDVTALINAQKQIDQLHLQEKVSLENLVSERTRELETAMKELLEKEKLASLGSLVSGIAHEINTPLGVAVSAASYLDTITNENTQRINDGTLTKNGLIIFMKNIAEGLDIMNSNLARAATLVNSFKQISVNQTYEELSNFKLKEYLETILMSLKHEIKIRKINIVINCDEALVIKTYQGALSQVFTNLIMNSMIHGYSYDEEGEILIDITRHSNHINIHYHDNGHGISDDNLQHIFEPFFTTKRGNGGSGLGLNIVYNIVTSKLLGKIVCKSAVGIGTTFEIDIPIL